LLLLRGLGVIMGFARLDLQAGEGSEATKPAPFGRLEMPKIAICLVSL